MTLREHLLTICVSFGLAFAAASCDASAPWVELRLAASQKIQALPGHRRSP